MNAAKHTPGPWEYKEVPYHAMSTRHQFQVWAEKGSIDGLTNYFVASIDDFNAEPCNEANACLIAAAPEMLEALELVLEKFAAPTEAVEKIQAVIRKARGTK